MAVRSSFVLVVCLIASGLMMCASRIAMTPEQIKALCAEMPEAGLGISLGMTYSSVMVLSNRSCNRRNRSRRGHVKVPNEFGNTVTPSCVAFTDSGEVLIGELAKDQQHVNPRRTICGVNRLIGKKFSDPDVRSYIKTLPYKVVNRDDTPYIRVEFGNGETKLYSVQEICSLILGKMKEIAEAYTGKEIRHTVVAFDAQTTDPDSTSTGWCFDDFRVKWSMIDAGKMAGLEIFNIWDCKGFVGPGLARALWARQRYFPMNEDHLHRAYACHPERFFDNAAEKRYVC